MQLVFTTTAIAELKALQRILGDEGVPSELHSTGANDPLTGAPYAQELWVLRDYDYPHARDVYEHCFRRSAAASRVATA
jgi:hypothetical protein